MITSPSSQDGLKADMQYYFSGETEPTVTIRSTKK
jgi:hypothetical protein